MSSETLNINNNELLTREEVVANALRKAILRGTFKPGEKLDQQSLAEGLGVSRSPVREALRTLAAEDLVTNIPHRGAIVTERSVAELEEILFMRVLLEGAAVRRAAPLMDKARLQRLEEIMASAEKLSEFQDILELNNDFHTTAYSAFEQPHLIKVIQMWRNKVAPYNRIFLDVPGCREKAWADHYRIYEACVARDGERAEQETKKHLEQVFEGILIAIKQT